jgi:hypothetical protein
VLRGVRNVFEAKEMDWIGVQAAVLKWCRMASTLMVLLIYLAGPMMKLWKLQP